MAQTLAASRNDAEQQRFIDGLGESMRRRFAGHPAPMHHLAGMIVLAKLGAKQAYRVLRMPACKS
jgi:hypothetical protein